MILLCWAATFGSDGSLDAPLAEHARPGRRGPGGQLGPARSRDARRALLPREWSCLRAAGRRERRAHAAQDRRAGLPGDQDARRAAGRARTAGRRPSGAAATASRRATWRARRPRCSTTGSPSLLNEAPVFLALHDACVDLGELEEARRAIARGRAAAGDARCKGLAGTPYARAFLTQLAPNAGLLAAAEAYGAGARRGDLRAVAEEGSDDRPEPAADVGLL